MNNLNVKEAVAMVNRHGWNLKADDSIHLDTNGYLVHSVGEPTDCTGYTEVIDPYTGKSRHLGNGRGCFWTDWA